MAPVKKNVLLLLVLLSSGSLIWYINSKSYFYDVPIKCAAHDLPMVEIAQDGKVCSLYVRIGSRFSLSLRKETIQKLSGEQKSSLDCYDEQGNRRDAPTYSLRDIHVGNLLLPSIEAIQTENHCVEALGMFLGGEYNILLDFLHSRIIACDSFFHLRARNLANKYWEVIPFEVQQAGIVFTVHTDLGPLKLAIDTLSENSYLSTSLISSSTSLTSSSFCLGKHDFGAAIFSVNDVPKSLQGIDGFIGMDFLFKHPIYLDYHNQRAYVAPPSLTSPSSYFVCLPVRMGKLQEPLVDGCIEGQKCSFFLDLGRNVPFSLKANVLQQMRIEPYRKIEWCDFKGNHYESSSYITLSDITLQSLSFSDLVVGEEREDFQENTTAANSSYDPEEFTGSIGWPILEKCNLLLDFPHSMIYACDNYKYLQQKGILSNTILEIPFTLGRDGIYLTVKTDIGSFSLKLDSGSTYTTIRGLSLMRTSIFCLAGHDFGPCEIRSIDLVPLCSYDGLLGMDFLSKYPIYIDYPRHLILLDLSADLLDASLK